MAGEAREGAGSRSRLGKRRMADSSPVLHSAAWLAEVFLSRPEPFKARGSREAAETGGAALRLAGHTAWFCQTTSCSPPPAPELAGILARAPGGLLPMAGCERERVWGASPVFLCFEKIMGLPWQSPPSS